MLNRERAGLKGMKVSGLTMIVAIVLLLAACGSNNGAGQEEADAARKVTDAMGNEVAIPAEPQRVIASYLEDHLVALGVKPAAQWSVPNGIQDYLQPGGLEGVPTISYNLPPEEVASFEPDLILIGSESSVQNDLYAQYSKIAPTYVLGDEVNADWRAALSKIGEVLGKDNEAKQALEAYEAKVKETKEKLGDTVNGKTAAILWLTQKQFYMVDNTVASGAVVYGDLGINPPNLVNEIPEEARASWNPISLEKLAELDADYIFLVNSDSGQTAETLDTGLWKSIPAVKAGHVYEMDTKSSWLYSGSVAGTRVMEDLAAVLAK
jgi:iron complex transport system substrate-binding protein